MHPPLTKDKHPLCGDVIDAFEACHKANVYNRFFGFCNEQKYALDKCFRAEKLVKARASLAKSKEDQQRLREIIAAREAEKAKVGAAA